MRLHQCYLTHNDCYRAGKAMRPQGVMVHSSGANNPRLSRYVAPNDGLLGEPAMRHWNQPGIDACPHAFIGKLADGSVATYQTLPWTMRGWHCGRSGNNTHISFEVCEDGLNDPGYFAAVYREAVELTAFLCQEYHLDPLEPGVVICHAEGYKLGIASNHGDVLHWWPKAGKTMDDFRRDVSMGMEAAELNEQKLKIEVPILKKGCKNDSVLAVQAILNAKDYNVNGVDGFWGPGMDAAFRKWQKDVGLEVDGSCGPASWGKLLCG